MNDLISRQAAIDALDVLCQEHRYKIPGKWETYSQYNEAWQDALDRAENAIFDLPSAQPRWIPCSERLPEPNRHDALNVDIYYLAQTEFGDMIVASYNESHEGTKWWEQMYSYRSIDDEIVAWMPLPEAWRPGND